MLKRNFVFGFTLAEVMIVLTVIGILSAIIFPVAIHSAPDKNILKFKKANTVLYRTIKELAHSGQYFKEEDLGTKPDETPIYGSFQLVGSGKTGTDDDVKYFCNAFADVVTTKSVNCSTVKTAGDDSTNTFVAIPSGTVGHSWQTTLSTGKERFDTACADNESTVGAEIVTTDGIVFYQANPAATFGIWWSPTRLFGFTDDNGLLQMYKVVCIDVDGIGKGEAPFGYGIRIDGRIIPGARADQWLEKSVNEE